MFKRNVKSTNTRKRKSVIPIAIGVLLLLSLIGNLGSNDRQNTKTLDSSDIEASVEIESSQDNSNNDESTKLFDELEIVARTKVLEYSNKEVDPLSLVKLSSSDFDVLAENTVDLSRIGKQTVTYIAENGENSKTFYIEYEVKDTKAPLLSIITTDLKLELGLEYNLRDNIRFVNDSVDGDLPYLESPSSNEEGYWFSGTFDTTTLGYYPITVSALDRNGNLTEKEFSITVIQPEPEAALEESPQDTSSETAAIVDASKEEESNVIDSVEEPTEPVFTYILNTNPRSMKFHYPGCRDVGKMKESNKQEVQATRDEVLSWGYSPCGHCHP